MIDVMRKVVSILNVWAHTIGIDTEFYTACSGDNTWSTESECKGHCSEENSSRIYSRDRRKTSGSSGYSTRRLY